MRIKYKLSVLRSSASFVQRIRSSAFVALVCCVMGCEENAPAPTSPPIAANQFTARRDPLVVDGPLRSFGLACDDVGAQGCADKVCLFGDPARPRFCSRPCSDAKPCPGGYACAQLHPSADAFFCLEAAAPRTFALTDGGAR